MIQTKSTQDQSPTESTANVIWTRWRHNPGRKESSRHEKSNATIARLHGYPTCGRNLLYFLRTYN